MTSFLSNPYRTVWDEEIWPFVEAGEFDKVADHYEKEISQRPEHRRNYWLLGLSQVLDQHTDLAQLSWLVCLSEASEIKVDEWIAELEEVLESEATRQFKFKNYQNSFLIRECIQHYNPENIANVCHLILLAHQLETLDAAVLQQWDLPTCIEKQGFHSLDQSLIKETMLCLLSYPYKETLQFASSFISVIKDGEEDSEGWIKNFLESGAKYVEHQDYSVGLLKLATQLGCNEIRYWRTIATYHKGKREYKQAVDAALHYLELADDLPKRLQAYYMLLNILCDGCMWKELQQYIPLYIDTFEQVLQNKPDNTEISWASLLVCSPSILQYLSDNPRSNRTYQNRFSSIAQEIYDQHKPKKSKSDALLSPTQKLTIGFIGHTFRVHSVGWLFRWVYKYFDRESLNIHLYMVDQAEANSFSELWFNNSLDQVRYCNKKAKEIAKCINADGVNILVDLDSSSYTKTCAVMGFKPAPIQVTWLGFDGSGLPAIDYYLADELVLPKEADTYYREKIWRLPETYLAIDGFEVDVPTLHRTQLDIPQDAIVFLSAQSGLKRNVETVRLQFKILKQVPNSYFLIKSGGDPEFVKKLFHQVAQEEGVDIGHLRFLERDENEFVHRANLAIADIILDTYPYNGATTTLEALWMEIPIVTKVGKQFAARNSFAFLSNVGVTEGVAFTDAEYVDWGVRLGTEPDLRCNVTWKLKQAKHRSPLWDTKRFTRNLEAAFAKMWDIYCQSDEDGK